MAQERDTRPLGEIRFAADAGIGREGVEVNIRHFLHRVGVGIGQDIIDMGCTGLAQGAYNLRASEGEEGSRCSLEECNKKALAEASFVRRNMAGSICGLPCYVPRDRYCLVHDTIGGLQLAGNFDGPQAQRHPEALPFMSRELTEEERWKVSGIEAKLSAEVKAAALAEYGATDLDDEAVRASMAYPHEMAAAPSCPIPQPTFKCPDHPEPDWDCRKCIAQVIVEAATAPHMLLIDGGMRSMPLVDALQGVNAGACERVELWVCVASWSKKVARD
jgi:hypothetical protein